MSLNFIEYRIIFLIFLTLQTSQLFSVPQNVWIPNDKYGQKYNIAIGNFSVFTAEETKFADDSAKVIRSDLLFTQLFDVLNVPKPVYGNQPDYTYWSSLGVQILVSGTVLIRFGNQVVFTGKVFDVESKEQIFSEVYQGTTDQLRKLAHQFVDTIVFRFTGEKGIAQSKIVFINDSTNFKEVWIMDYDGANIKQLTEDKSIATMPKWSYDGKKVFYTTYKKGNPDVYCIDIATGKKTPFLEYSGLNVMGSANQDGRYLTAVLSKDGNPEVYLLSSSGELVRRITWNSAVDVSPSFSPNNRDIVFTSGRSGLPQLYVTDLDGVLVRRLTYIGYCDSPNWSPKGRLIAYAYRESHNFQISIVEPDATNSFPTQITREGSNENPAWSSNGQWLVFATNRNGKYEIYRTTPDGTIQQRVAQLKGNSISPNWSQ